MKKTMNAHRIFFLTLFFPVNVLFQALCFASLSFRPDLGSAGFFILLLKATYFLMTFFSIYYLKFVWRSVADMLSPRAAWTYRVAGLAAIAALLFMHAEHVYQFGQAEREIRRNLISTNKTLPSPPYAGVRADLVRLERRDWVYEITMTQLSVNQIDRAKFAASIRAQSGIFCAIPWHRRLFELGVRVRYLYLDRDGGIVADEAFGSDTCSGRA